MRLDVGTPSEKVILANGKEAEARDYIGLLLDSRLYAKKDCRDCYGRGILTVVTPIKTAQALKLIAANLANEALLHQNDPGKYTTRDARMCNCAKRRYRKQHGLFADALVKEKLATYAGTRVEADGHKQNIIELL